MPDSKRRRRIVPALLVMVVAATGCVSLTAVLREAKEVSKDPTDVAKRTDVAVVLVSAADGKVYPDQLIVRRGFHAIVWVCDEEFESITFMNPPAGRMDRPSCLSHFCFVKLVTADPTPPVAGTPPGYKYKIKIKNRPEIDPRMEVVM